MANKINCSVKFPFYFGKWEGKEFTKVVPDEIMKINWELEKDKTVWRIELRKCAIEEAVKLAEENDKVGIRTDSAEFYMWFAFAEKFFERLHNYIR